MYITKQDIENRIGTEKLGRLMAILGSSGGDEIIQAEIERSESIANSYIARQYSLPLPVVPDIVKHICVNIAVYFLYYRAGQAEVVSDVRQGYDDAMQMLNDIATRKCLLPIPPETSRGVRIDYNDREDIFSYD